MTAEQAVAFAEELARIAAAGGGAKAFASHLAGKTHAGVLVEDAEWKHLAAAGQSGAVSVRELIDVQNAKAHPARFTNGRPGFALAISAGDVHFGWLAVFTHEVDTGIEIAARLTASAIAVELAREQGGHRGRQRTFWERLVGRSYHDTATARDEAAARGIALSSHYVAVSLEAEVAEESNAAAQRAELRRIVVETFRPTQGDAGVLERAGDLLIVVPAPREIDAANVRTAATLLPRSATKKLKDLRFSGGVGGQQPLLSAYVSAEQAVNAMLIGRRMYGSNRVVAFDELGVYPLLFEGAKVEELRTFARNRLSALREYDEKHQTELERTLALYFEVGENVKIAAARLNVHRHTVFYRLRQISEICGCKLDDVHDQLTLRMALAIEALHE